MPLPTDLEVHLRPLLQRRIQCEGRVLSCWWEKPPKGGRYRMMLFEVDQLFDVNQYVFLDRPHDHSQLVRTGANTAANKVNRNLRELDIETWKIRCRLPTSLLDEVPSPPGKLDYELRVYLSVRIVGFDGDEALGERPRTPGRIRPRPEPEEETDLDIDDDIRRHQQAEDRAEQEAVYGDGRQEQFARGDRTTPQRTPEELAKLMQEFDEAGGQVPKQYRQQKENDQ